jgi:hypothetical protein
MRLEEQLNCLTPVQADKMNRSEAVIEIRPDNKKMLKDVLNGSTNATGYRKYDKAISKRRRYYNLIPIPCKSMLHAKAYRMRRNCTPNLYTYFSFWMGAGGVGVFEEIKRDG